MTADPMQRAREMLAAEYEADGAPASFTAELRSGNLNRTGCGTALRALAKALTREDEVRGEAERAWPLLQKAWIAIVELTGGGPSIGSDLARLLDEMNRCETALRAAIRSGRGVDQT